jgi:hypothetical protein
MTTTTTTTTTTMTMTRNNVFERENNQINKNVVC